MAGTHTATQLLDTAQRLVQERGFNAFSYRDLADAVGVKTASIHYHFKTKADLGKALIDRYLGDLEGRLAAIDASSRTSRGRLKAFVELYRTTAQQGRICLCGSLAADAETLRDDVRGSVDAYLARSENWVRAQIDRGVREGEFSPAMRSADLAAMLVAGLQGALVLGRARGDETTLDPVQRSFWKVLDG